jgi:hypothetical protein
MKEQEITKLEFLMMVNDNIIVQRYFNVRDYNHNVRNSMDFKEYMDGLIESLNYQLKMKAVTYLLENQYEITNNPSILETSYIDGPEYFNIYLKQGDKLLCHRRFDAKIYPPKIRYTVDIRQTIKIILQELTSLFSSKDLSFDYLGLSTKV